jgi:GAF domain-containing protein
LEYLDIHSIISAIFQILSKDRTATPYRIIKLVPKDRTPLRYQNHKARSKRPHPTPLSELKATLNPASVDSDGKAISMTAKYANSVQLIGILRWVVPLCLAITGTAYVLLKEIAYEGHDFLFTDVLIAFLGNALIDPVLAWLALTWIERTAKAQAMRQEELAERNQELAALNAIGEVASTSLDLDSVLYKSLRTIREIIGLQAAEIRLVEDGQLVLKSHYGVSDNFVASERLIPLGHCFCGMCAQQGRTFGENRLSAMPVLVNTACAREGFESTLSIPMKAGGRVIGVIHVASRERDAFTAQDEHTLTAVGQRIATIVENAHLYEQAQRRAFHLETASLFGQRITALLDLDMLMNEVARLICEKFGYYHAHIFLVDENSREIVLRSASGVAEQKLREHPLRLKIGQEGITGWVAHSGQTLVCNDVRREPRYLKSELVPHTQSELAVPLRVGTRVIGVLDIQSNRINGFDKEEVTIAQILGNQLGIAIENARLFAETKSRYEAMVALHEISLDLISQLDRGDLLQALLRRGVRLWGALAGSIFLYDEDHAEIHSAANYNLPWDLTNVIFRLGEGLAGRVIQTGEALFVNNYQTWEGRIPAYANSHLTAVMCAPLKWQQQLIGAISILDDSKKHFGENDIALLASFADLATIAIKNAELHTQVKEFSQQLEDKVEERTQQLLLAKGEIASQAEKLRSVFAKAIHVQEEERARIARDMHDGVMQLISAQRYELKAAKLALESKSESVAMEKLDVMRQNLGEMDKELRHAIYDLHPPALDAVDLVPALHKYTRTFGEVFGIFAEVVVTGNPVPFLETLDMPGRIQPWSTSILGLTDSASKCATMVAVSTMPIGRPIAKAITSAW